LLLLVVEFVLLPLIMTVLDLSAIDFFLSETNEDISMLIEENNREREKETKKKMIVCVFYIQNEIPL